MWRSMMTNISVKGGSTGARIKRYASVSSAMGSTVAKAATNKILGRKTDHGVQAMALTKVMGKLKGPVMKIAQMLSTIPDAVPPEYALEFQSLQSEAPAMGWPFVRRRMQAELGPDWHDHFHIFEREATSAASLGQVHKAQIRGPEGELLNLACKLQYPDMPSTVQADLNQLRMVLKIYESTMGGVKTKKVHQEIEERLYEELDYTLEAKTLKEFDLIYKSATFQGASTVHVPRVIQPLSTSRLLTMTWLEGEKLRDILDTPQDYRNKMAKLAFRAWYYPFFQHGIIHGDPHLGNYTFRQESDQQQAGINMFDFGCVRRFEPKFIEGVKNLYQAMDTQDKNLEVHAFEILGFKNLSKDVIDVLRQWAGLLYEPVLDDRVRPMQPGHSGVYGREMAEKIHKELRKVGGVTPPQEFVFMDRAAVGVGSLCMHLRAEANWCQIYREMTTPGMSLKSL